MEGLVEDFTHSIHNPSFHLFILPPYFHKPIIQTADIHKCTAICQAMLGTEKTTLYIQLFNYFIDTQFLLFDFMSLLSRIQGFILFLDFPFVHSLKNNLGLYT